MARGSHGNVPVTGDGAPRISAEKTLQEARVLFYCVALLVRNWRRRNRDGRVWFLALATLIAAAPFLLLILLLVYLPGVGALFP